MHIATYVCILHSNIVIILYQESSATEHFWKEDNSADEKSSTTVRIVAINYGCNVLCS